jgi:alpha-L-fucosidase
MLAATLSIGAQPRPVIRKSARYINPLPLEASSRDGSPQGVSLGDVTVVREGDLYYLFGTGGGAWVSRDFVNWKYQPVGCAAVASVAPSQELIDKYQPDLLYFDNTELPLGQAGLDIAAHLYNSSIKRHGKLEAVLNSKGLKSGHAGTMVLDIERGRADRILATPWQTDTCIGDWHYRRSTFELHRYKTARQVVQTLVDIVSKNGNLLLNIPLRGDGSIDEDESRFLDGLASWMQANREAIFGTRPFTIFGEGAPDVQGSGHFNEGPARAYTSKDIRFTAKGDILYATALDWPEDGKLIIATLGQGRAEYPKQIGKIELLGDAGRLPFVRESNGLIVTLPEIRPSECTCVLKIHPA